MNVISKEDKDALKACRLQRQELRRMSHEAMRLRIEQGGVRGVKIDGMPKQCAKAVDRIAETVARLDDLDRRYMRELRRMVKIEDAARAALDRILPTPSVYAFLLRYYIDAAEFEEAYRAADISKRQGQRYKSMVE